MITSLQELKTTQERITYFQRMLMQLRVTASPEEFPYVASSYQAELEKMQAEVLDYEEALKAAYANFAEEDEALAESGREERAALLLYEDEA